MIRLLGQLPYDACNDILLVADSITHLRRVACPRQTSFYSHPHDDRVGNETFQILKFSFSAGFIQFLKDSLLFGFCSLMGSFQRIAAHHVGARVGNIVRPERQTADFIRSMPTGGGMVLRYV